MACVCYPRTQEVEVGGSGAPGLPWLLCWVWGYHGLQETLSLSIFPHCCHGAHGCPGWCSQECQQCWEMRQMPGSHSKVIAWLITVMIKHDYTGKFEIVNEEWWTSQTGWASVEWSISDLRCSSKILETGTISAFFLSFYWQPQLASWTVKNQGENA